MIVRIILFLQVSNRCVYIAGQIAMTPADLSIVPGGAAVQARLALRHVARVLAAKAPLYDGTNSLVMVVCYVTHADYIEAADREWNRFKKTCVSIFYRRE